MIAGRNRIGIISLGAAFAGFLLVTFQPWLALDSVWLFRGLSLRGLLSAFFDASLVGALADWFAVTALFRSPLGIRLPHTDILARNKDAIAEAVPRFLTSFVSEERIAEQLGTIDFGDKVEAWYIWCCLFRALVKIVPIGICFVAHLICASPAKIKAAKS